MWMKTDLLITMTLAVVFISLGSLRTLLIKFSENDNGHYNYLPVSVNVCSEFLKLVLCLAVAIRVLVAERKRGKGLFCGGKGEFLQFMKWAIPGLLYFFDNLIAFYSIEYFQPALVVLLGNFYIITTSLLFRLILKRHLTRVQWTSIFILFMSIMLLSLQTSPSLQPVDHHKSHHAITPSVNSSLSGDCTPSTAPPPPSTDTNSSLGTHHGTTTSSSWRRDFNLNFHEGHVLVLIQCLIASTANVYNEKIFKEDGGLEDSIYVQNSKLYFFGFLFNAVTLGIHSGYRERVLTCGLFNGHNYFSFSLIFVTAFYGLTVALIFKFRDNMFHVLSTQVTTILVITASMYYFHFKPSVEFFLSAPIVLAAIYLFHTNKAKSEVVDFDEGRRPELVFREEEGRPLVPVLDQNED